MKILIADDNNEFCTTVADIVAAEGWSYAICNSPVETLAYLEQNERSVGLVLLDIEFNHPAMNGLDVLEKSVKRYPNIPVVMVTGVGTIDTAVRATRLGAVNFIEKSSIGQGRLREVLYIAMEKVNRDAETEELSTLLRRSGLIGKSRKMFDVAEKIMQYGRTELNVLITGETGTGKKLVAMALHSVSRRAKQHFVTVDIPNIPANLFQSELFGCVKGAFTGATENKYGLFQRANKGTIFLDEIGDLAGDLQANLLLPVEEKIVRRLGSVESERIDVRFISATDKRLPEAIRNGEFREQLYHRLRECEISIPPLRERKEDIPAIVDHYVGRHNEAFGEEKVFTQAALEYMQDMPWYGNIRELENVVKVAVQVTRGSTVDIGNVVDALPPTITKIYDGSDLSRLTTDDSLSLREEMERINQVKIRETLERCYGNVSKAASQLGISRETLHNRIKRFNIDVNEYRRRRYQQ
jgi:DNA-binding NtrC family response regulator